MIVTQTKQNMNIPHQIHNDQSYVALRWEFQDNDSPITKHVISLKTHHDGEIPLSNLLFGNVKNATIPLALDERLHDGALYTAVVTACNSAGLCTSETSPDTLIDSTPPLRGLFSNDMTWRRYPKTTQVHIKWKDFSDPHSQIHRYFLTVSLAYNGYDLSGGVIQVMHSMDKDTQDVPVNLSSVIDSNTKVVVNIIAENYAGLLSDSHKVTLTLFASDKEEGGGKAGPLQIVHHSCDIHYCTLDCTCAAVDQICIPETPLEDCIENNVTGVLQVFDGQNGVPVSFSVSSMCLHAFWKYDGLYQQIATHGALAKKDRMRDLVFLTPQRKNSGLIMNCIQSQHTAFHMRSTCFMEKVTHITPVYGTTFMNMLKLCPPVC